MAIETDGKPCYAFTPKRRWEVKLHMMSGVTVRDWGIFLTRNFKAIDWLTYGHRVVFLSFMSIVNTLLASFDWFWYREAIATQPLHPEPVFILGHPRSGTTHLQNLLSLDPHFAFCSTFHAGFPSSFICLERFSWIMAPLLSKTRPMDNMKLTWELPAEDEIGLNTITGGASPYILIVLPKEERYWQHYTFGKESSRPAEEAAATAAEAEAAASSSEQSADQNSAQLEKDFECWHSCMIWLFKKLTLRHALEHKRKPEEGAPLLIRSPVHTARMSMFYTMFPRARFLYIHRHPIQVFKSSANLADMYYWYTYLQKPTDEVTTEFILKQYELLFDRYMEDKKHIPAAQLHELSFDGLEQDPMGTLTAIYDHFGWSERFNALRPKFEKYFTTLSDFKKNDLKPLSPELEAEVRRRWAPSFSSFGYK